MSPPQRPYLALRTVHLAPSVDSSVLAHALVGGRSDVDAHAAAVAGAVGGAVERRDGGKRRMEGKCETRGGGKGGGFGLES